MRCLMCGQIAASDQPRRIGHDAGRIDLPDDASVKLRLTFNVPSNGQPAMTVPHTHATLGGIGLSGPLFRNLASLPTRRSALCRRVLGDTPAHHHGRADGGPRAGISATEHRGGIVSAGIKTWNRLASRIKHRTVGIDA